MKERVSLMLTTPLCITPQDHDLKGVFGRALKIKGIPNFAYGNGNSAEQIFQSIRYIVKI